MRTKNLLLQKMQKVVDDEKMGGFDKEQQIEELADYVDRVEIELGRLTDLSTLKIEDLTIVLPIFDGSMNSLEHGSLTTREEPLKSNSVMIGNVRSDRPTSSCSNDTRTKLSSLAEKKAVLLKQTKPANVGQPKSVIAFR